jgi:hypothetical protein
MDKGIRLSGEEHGWNSLELPLLQSTSIKHSKHAVNQNLYDFDGIRISEHIGRIRVRFCVMPD